MSVITLLAPKVEGAHGEICNLSKITYLPKNILSFVQSRVPSFKLRRSKTTGSRHYANTCPKCGVLYGDWYLHSEPGAAFFL